MKAYEVGDYARSGQLRLVERPDPVPGHGEALLRVRATGPNARDFAIWKDGMASRRPAAPDFVPLCDLAADVVAVGHGVTEVAPGDRVTMIHYARWLDGRWDESMRDVDYGFTRDGFLRELAVVPAAALVRIPGSLSYEHAATLPSAGLTAWQAVAEEGRLRPGDTVVTLGTGGVSVFAMQWAKLLGARVIVTSSSEAKLARMRELGADGTVNYRGTPAWSQGVLAQTGGRGAALVINTVGLAELDQCLEASASGGRIMYVGASPVTTDRVGLAGVVPKRLGLLIMRDLTLKGIIVGSRRMMVDMVRAMDQHAIRPIIDRVYDFGQANEALEYFANTGKIGKVVIRVGAAVVG
ncbi:MAG: NAD(P)-dependent alcohol dehydrogenase [Gammaproteobacteria bacterium]|nr:NAD(P)-dependent alcohol dehydrogenase [Gammaproteobacteria bacterium]